MSIEPERASRLGDWFAAKLGHSFGEVTRVSRAAGGASNETLLVDVSVTEGGRTKLCHYVVRVQPGSSHDCFLDADVLKQSALMRAVKERTNVPLPKVFWEEADPGTLGASFYVMEYVHGRVPSTFPSYHSLGWVTELSLEQRRLMETNGLRVLAAIHNTVCRDLVPLFATNRGGPPGLGSFLNWVDDYHDWAREGVAYPLLESALAYLHRECPSTQEARLNWGDCRPGNMLFADDLSVAAVLDWENALIGPPEVDLGWWLMMNWWQTEGTGARPLKGFLDREETIAMYESFLGRRVNDMHYFEVLAFTRYVILSVRSTNLLIRSGAVPAGSTMAIGCPLGQKLADLLNEPRPELSSDYLRIIASYQAGKRPALENENHA